MSENYEDLILNHYRRIAKGLGLSKKSTMEDLYVRDKEIEFFVTEIQKQIEKKGTHLRILDAGCGNGHLLSVLCELFPSVELFGVEFTPELVELAQSRNLPNVKISHGSLKNFEDLPRDLDVVITERVIINILDNRDQYLAVEHISKSLKDDGIYLLSESFFEPWVELNHARKEMCLEEVEQSYQNKYLTEKFVERMPRFGLFEFETEMPKNFLSSHFYVTRVLHKSLRPEGGKVKFSRFAQFFTEALPPAIGNFSPILFRAFRKDQASSVSVGFVKTSVT